MEKPPFQLTPLILNLVAKIQGLLGELRDPINLVKPPIKLRKENKIKTVHHSLAIEGNTLSEAQITALLENKRWCPFLHTKVGRKRHGSHQV